MRKPTLNSLVVCLFFPCETKYLSHSNGSCIDASDCAGPLEPRSSLESCLAKGKSELLVQTDSFQLTLKEGTLCLITAKKRKRETELVFGKKRQTASGKRNPGSSSVAHQPHRGRVYVWNPLGSSTGCKREKNEIGGLPLVGTKNKKNQSALPAPSSYPGEWDAVGEDHTSLASIYHFVRENPTTQETIKHCERPRYQTPQ